MQPATEVKAAHIRDETLIAAERRDVDAEIDALRAQIAVLSCGVFVVRH